MLSRAATWLTFTAMAAFLIAPVVVVAGISLNERKRLFFPPEGISGRWYVEMVVDAGWRGAIFNSLAIAALAAALAVTIALPIAYAAWRHRLLYARVLFGMGIAPFLLPPVITALGFMIFWASIDHFGRFENVVIAHAMFLVTLPLMTTSLGLESIDRALIEAGQTMGADEWTLFRTGILPRVLPYLIAGYAFAFVLSLNEYVVAYMVAGFTVETLPIKIFNALRSGYTPVLTSVTVLFVAIAVVIFGIIGRYGDLPRMMGRWSRD